MIGKTDRGRLLNSSVLSPSLKNGVTLATFHESGKQLVSIDVQENKRIFNKRQPKLQKVARDVVSPKALCCLNSGKCIPDFLHFNSPEVEYCFVFVIFIVTCKKGIWGCINFVRMILQSRRNCSLH